jgi:hypothetical protein
VTYMYKLGSHPWSLGKRPMALSSTPQVSFLIKKFMKKQKCFTWHPMKCTGNYKKHYLSQALKELYNANDIKQTNQSRGKPWLKIDSVFTLNQAFRVVSKNKLNFTGIRKPWIWNHTIKTSKYDNLIATFMTILISHACFVDLCFGLSFIRDCS